MSDIVTTARTARELLAKGLGALQANPNVPSQYLEAAEPIAAAMGALHTIERTGGAEVVSASAQALDAVRRALSLLQAQATSDPAMMSVMETVASSLSHVFALTKMQSSAAAAPTAAAPTAAAPYVPPVQPQAPAGWQQPAPQPAAAPVQPAAWQPPAQPTPYAPPQAAPMAPQPAPYAPPPQPAPYAPPPQPAAYAPPMPAAQAAPYSPPPQPVQQAWQPPAPVAQPAQPPQPQQPAALPAQPQPVAQQVPPGQASSPYAVTSSYPRVEAELGTHSPSNFYKGLAGNDVVDHGGIFIATYKIPRVGETLRVHVSLPGGYEFEAVGVVRWTRESRDSMTTDIAPPGFGLQFTQISPEARQLVYRYARNREPLFHDDL